MIAKDYLNLAGEYRVCAELLKRSLFATITYGNKKGVDIFAIGEGSSRRVAVVEVKASNSNRFTTSFYQKYPDPEAVRPDFWVLCSIQEISGEFEEQFFILSHDELAAIQAERNCPAQTLSYKEVAARCAKGVDNVLIKNVKDHRDEWHKIINFCKPSK